MAERQWIHIRYDVTYWNCHKPPEYLCGALRHENDGGTVSMRHWTENPAGHARNLNLCHGCEARMRQLMRSKDAGTESAGEQLSDLSHSETDG